MGAYCTHFNIPQHRKFVCDLKSSRVAYGNTSYGFIVFVYIFVVMCASDLWPGLD